MNKRPTALALAVALGTLSAQPGARATTMDDVLARLNALESSNRRLERENKEFRHRLGMAGAADEPSRALSSRISREIATQLADKHARALAAVEAAPSPHPIVSFTKDNKIARAFLDQNKTSKLSLNTPNGEVLLYGNLDVSVDGITKGIGGKRDDAGHLPVGHVGWLPDVATNKSYVGVRGYQDLGSSPLKFIYQLETLIDISAQSGVSETNSSASNVVRGALTSRNSFLGVSDPALGMLRIGKTDAPYYTSTARLNPFQAMLGDYSVIMGNTGGDNRVEFATRLDHSIWYDSPIIDHFQYSLLFSPGQNRGYQNDNIAAGESDCTGGNIPGSGSVGGLQPNSCSDGSFGDAISTTLVYSNGPLYGVLAYERHFAVNRSSDIGQVGGGGVGIYANAPTFLVLADTADEDAAKAALQYKFQTGTTVDGMVEHLTRYVPKFLQFQNERQRWGTWFAVEQRLTPVDSVAFGWAHAFRAPGDPGQHNDGFYSAPYQNEGDLTGGPHVDNSANLLTAAYIRQLTPGLTWYTDVAATLNGPYAHYDLGAGGHGVTTDCHDGYGAQGGIGANPHCWAGGQLVGVSSGLHLNF